MSVTATDKTIAENVASWIARNAQPSPALRSLTDQATADFIRLGLPVTKAEEYKHTPITRTIEKAIDFSLANAASELDPSAFFIGGIDAQVLVFINGIFASKHSDISLSSGVTIVPLAEALTKDSELVTRYIGHYADHKTDALTAWNTASWKDGVFIHIADDTVITKPILIYQITDTSKGQVITVNRNLFVIGKNSEVTIIEKFDSVGSGNAFCSVVTEGVVAANGSLNLYSIQNDSASHFNQKHIHQGDKSRVNTFTYTLDGKLVRNNLQLALDGENIESHMYGLYLLKGDTLADNHTTVDHKKPNAFSNELYKGIMDGNSKGVFNGKIYVRPNAQKTNAFQANKNILLTNAAAVNTKPQLEIWADDVKCSHGCTTGQLDEEALFYLQSRGIQKETARAMMLYAFAAETLQNIKVPAVSEYLDKLIRARFNKEF